MMPAIRPVAAAFASVFLLLRAEAETPPAACPADAEQQLYDVLLDVTTGRQTQIKPILEKAGWAVATCPDRREVTGLAVLLASVILEGSQDINTVSQAADIGLQAYELNGKTADGPSVEVTAPGGETQKLYLWNDVSQRYRAVVVPRVVALANAGVVKPHFSDAPLAACPYVEQGDFRLATDVKDLASFVTGQHGEPNFIWATNRLKALSAACGDLATPANFALGKLYGTAATDTESRTSPSEIARDTAILNEAKAYARTALVYLNMAAEYRVEERLEPFQSGQIRNEMTRMTAILDRK
jgi:hypothetical protein